MPTPRQPAGNGSKLSRAYSMQGFGRALPEVGAAATDLHTAAKAQATQAAEFAQAMRRAATKAESELPARSGVVSGLQSIASRATRVAAEMEANARSLAALKGEAEALPATYKREHADDEDRANGARGGVAKEKRADVREAEKEI